MKRFLSTTIYLTKCFVDVFSPLLSHLFVFTQTNLDFSKTNLCFRKLFLGFNLLILDFSNTLSLFRCKVTKINDSNLNITIKKNNNQYFTIRLLFYRLIYRSFN